MNLSLFISAFEASMGVLSNALYTLYPSIQGSVSAGAVNVVIMSLEGLASLMEMCQPMLETFTHEQLSAIWHVLAPTIGYMNTLVEEIVKNLSSNTIDASSAELLEELIGVLTQVLGQAKDLAGEVGGYIF